MISKGLARRLRDAGLRWQPRNGDLFLIPDRNLDDQVFAISDMTVDVKPVPGGRLIAFNGTVEWALDSIMQWEVVWLPSEAQLRDALGGAFVSLSRRGGRYSCEMELDGRRLSFEHQEPAECYGLAVLHRLEHATPVGALGRTAPPPEWPLA